MNNFDFDEDRCKKCKGTYCTVKIPIFSGLNDEELLEISKLIERRRYKKGQVIFFEGDIFNKLYIIHRGKVKIYKYTKEGKEQILYILSEGEFIGDMHLLKSGAAEFNAEALEDVTICTFTKENFEAIIKTSPAITFNILEKMHDRIVNLENLVKTLSTKDVESRLAAMLISFGDSFGEPTEAGIEINTPLNREDMANFIGITRETISRKLTSLAEEGIIELIGNKKIVIKQLDSLKELI